MRFESGRRLVVPSVAAAAIVVLVLSPAASSDARAPESVTNTAAGPATVTVSFAGDGAGWVWSDPPGISCSTNAPTYCSAQFPKGIILSFGTMAASGSRFAGWTNCGGPRGEPGSCWFPNLVGDISVEARFDRAPSYCIVPRVTRRTLAEARARIETARCTVGTVTRVFSLDVQKGRVISQNPKAHWQATRHADGMVDLVVGKGRR